MTRTTPHGLRLLPILAVAWLALPGTAFAQGITEVFEYFDAHPIPGSIDGDVIWCLQEGRHTHGYALDPDQEPIYVVDDVTYYVGDTVVAGAPMEAVWYWGAHPLAHLGHAWCVLDGPHAHYWRPWWRASSWSSSSWSVRDGYWTWVSGYDDWYRWSHDRWYGRQRAIQVWSLEHPRYAPRYQSSRHPGVVYVIDRRATPSWDPRRREDSRTRTTPSTTPRRTTREPTRSSGDSSRRRR